MTEAYKAVYKCGAVTGAVLAEAFSLKELHREIDRMALSGATVIAVEKLGWDPLTVERCKRERKAAKSRKGGS